MKLSVRDLDVSGKRVLVRVDFNVPTEEKDGHIAAMISCGTIPITSVLKATG